MKRDAKICVYVSTDVQTKNRMTVNDFVTLLHTLPFLVPPSLPFFHFPLPPSTFPSSVLWSFSTSSPLPSFHSFFQLNPKFWITQMNILPRALFRSPPLLNLGNKGEGKDIPSSKLRKYTPRRDDSDSPVLVESHLEECVHASVSRMEETVRSLLQSQGSPEHKREEPSKITAYEVQHVSDSLVWFGFVFLLGAIESPLF